MGMNWETGSDIHTLLGKKEITMREPTAERRKLSSVLWDQVGRKSKESVHIHIPRFTLHMVKHNNLKSNYTPTKINLKE